MPLTIQEQIDRILSDRQKNLPEVREQKNYWDERTRELEQLADAIRTAESRNNGTLSGLSGKIGDSAKKARKMANEFAKVVERFDRDYICIGIGGAARMGKSTFLQAVTGLGEAQIPTSDKYYTTAGRSLIVNGPVPEAIADMHNAASFLSEIIAPLCEKINIPKPLDIEEFRRMEIPSGENDVENSVANRLRDAQWALPEIECELTGEKKRHIAIDNLRSYVAYPQGGKSKAGKFMAVADITIYAPFPETEVQQLHVMDLPGLGEPGVNLKSVQTKGMAERCDLTLLMKRPHEANVAWTDFDTHAIDALQEAAPVADQTQYTLILANVGDKPVDRADACVDDIRQHFSRSGRNFKIIRCNAKDATSVRRETMPEMLAFLAANLPAMDATIFQSARQEAETVQKEIKTALTEIKGILSEARGSMTGTLDLKNKIYNNLLDDLCRYSQKLTDAAEAIDDEWNKEVTAMANNVKNWIKTDCGFGSIEKLEKAFRKEFNKAPKGRPRDAINAVRVAFRKQWSEIDQHLEKRIATVLMDFIDIIKKHTNSFIPPRRAETLAGVQQQLRDTADKLQNAPDLESHDEERLAMLTEPLRRLSEFELRFRFHLEPLLIGATAAIRTENFPEPQGIPDEEKAYTGKIVEFLNKVTDIYSKSMQMTGSAIRENPLHDIQALLRDTLKDDRATCDALEAEIAKAVGASSMGQQFIPNKIFAAVIENATHAILLCDGAEDAFAVWARAYAGELREQPSPAALAASEAYSECAGLLKKFQ